MSQGEQKGRRSASPVAKGMVKAAAATVAVGRYARSGDPTGTKASAVEAVTFAAPATFLPLTDLEVAGVGAGGDLILNMPVPAGDLVGLRLRDVTKDPGMVNATAQLDRLRLAEEAGALDIAIDTAGTIKPRNSLEKMMAHQLAALHVLSMRQAAMAGRWLDQAVPDEYSDPHRKAAANVEASRASAAASKLMQTFQQGVATLQRARSDGQQKVTVVHQHVQVAGGNVAVAGAIQGGGGDDRGRK